MAGDEVEKFFIAIVPPSPVFEQALELKNYFKDQYRAKAALNSPPHITLHMPFDWKKRKEKELCDHLTRFSKTQASFTLRLSGFSSFAPRVIFIRVLENHLLRNLQEDLHRFSKRELNLFNARYKEQPFHPHLTLAFRDLKKPAFTLAWEEFKDQKFEGDFDVQNITLLKHNGKRWDPFEIFLLA